VHFGVVAVFLVLVFFYFSPIFSGKTLRQSDVVQAEGSQKELFDYKARAPDGRAPKWTNSMFGGMPTYQIWYEHATNVTTYISRAVQNVLPIPTDIAFLYLLGGYFLLSVLGIRPWLAAVGAVAIAFTSYNYIYLEAGHLGRSYAIAYYPFILGSILMSYRGSRLWGPTLLALFLALEIRANHVQMTYYLFIALLVYLLFALYYAYKDGKWKDFLLASGLQIAAVTVAVAVNASVLFPTYEYSQLTIRGKANLEKTDEDGKAKAVGLDREYAFQWSQGVGENLTLLVPNAYGGRSGGVLDGKSEVAKYLTGIGVPPDQATNFARGMPTYWGEKPFTSGAWYLGAGMFFLFVLALLVVPGRMKWWLLTATLLLAFLAMGRHFPLLSNLFFDHFPMYSKFRAVEAAMAIPAVLMPLMAILGLHEIITRGKEIPMLDKKVLYTFFGVGGICLIIALLPNLFLDFKPSNHGEFVRQMEQVFGGDKNRAAAISRALVQDRAALASADAFRSLFVIALTFGLVWFYIKKKTSAVVFVALLGVVVLADLWSVDKRYLNDDSFVTVHSARTHIPEREVDQLIRLDKDLSYRVLDLTFPQKPWRLPRGQADAVSGGCGTAVQRRDQRGRAGHVQCPLPDHEKPAERCRTDQAQEHGGRKCLVRPPRDVRQEQQPGNAGHRQFRPQQRGLRARGISEQAGYEPFACPGKCRYQARFLPSGHDGVRIHLAERCLCRVFRSVLRQGLESLRGRRGSADHPGELHPARLAGAGRQPHDPVRLRPGFHAHQRTDFAFCLHRFGAGIAGGDRPWAVGEIRRSLVFLGRTAKIRIP